MSQTMGKEIRIHKSTVNGLCWEWTASINLGHMAWTAAGAAQTKEDAIEQAEAFIAEIKAEGWQL